MQKLVSLALALGLCFFILWGASGEQRKEVAHRAALRQGMSLEVLYTRDLYGHAELCGCSPAQHGGLPRQSAFFIEHQKKDPTSVVIRADCGNFFPKTDDPAQQIHIAQMIQGYAALKYDAINVGTVEASYGREVLQKLRASGLPVTSASVLDKGGSPLFPQFIMKERNGVKIAFVGVIGQKVASQGLTVLEPAEALKRALSAVAAQRPDVLILLGDLGTNEAIDLAKRFKELNVVLSAKGLSFSPATPAYIAPWSGEYGKNVGLAFLKYQNGSLSFRSSFFPLSSSVASDEAVKKVIEAARTRAATEIKIQPHQVKEPDKWVGSAQCRACHSREYDIWHASKHSTAIKILKEQNAAARLDCISCHVTGYKVDTGAYSEESVGCEACHGPGKDHIGFFTGKTKELPSMKATSSVCVKCHNEPNSPLFSFDYYWEKIKH